MPEAKKPKTEISGIFVEQSTESSMILELRERKHQTEMTFKKLCADHKEYIAKYGRTWLRK